MLKKQVQKEKEQIEKQLWHLFKQGFNCKKDAMQALQKLQQKWRFHNIKDEEVTVKKQKTSGGRGRPKNTESLKNVFFVHATITRDEEMVQQAVLRKGRFIIATNVLDKELSDEDIVQAYKD